MKRAVTYWRCGAIVPYQWRHSEVQKRGRWVSQKSVARYEKGARLGVAWNELDVVTRNRMLECEKHLPDLVLGTHKFGKVTVD